jgi:hypothetical protein
MLLCFSLIFKITLFFSPSLTHLHTITYNDITIPYNDITIPYNDITIPYNDITIPYNDKVKYLIYIYKYSHP